MDSDSEVCERITKLRTSLEKFVPRFLRNLPQKFLQMQTRAPVFIVVIVFTAAIYSPLSPKFDIFTFHKTPQEIFFLTSLLLWVVLYLQRIHQYLQTYINEKLQDILLFICVALFIFSASLLVKYIKPGGEDNTADQQSKVLSAIPLALTVFPEVADKLLICVINGLNSIPHSINHMLRTLAGMTRRLGYLPDTLQEDLERNSNEVQESTEL